MKISETPLSGAYLITLPSSLDERGSFVKTYHETAMKKMGINFTLRESYYSLSKKDVIRGMHFQMPPHQHSKIISCPQGAILDVIVDLRKNSPTFKQHFANVLSAVNHQAYYIPEGFAHGFMSLADNTITCYLVSSEYSQPHDTGIRYDTIGYDWDVKDPILSDRDLSFRALDEFDSPFVL